MMPSAGAMFSTSTFSSQPARNQQGRRAEPRMEGQEPEKKPKKVNSEIRKQQNRIASRNYREKRKRKLQYLQQLLKDGDSGDEAARNPDHIQGQRMLTPEYHVQRHPSPGLPLPPNNGYSTLTTSSGNVIDPVLASTTGTYDSHLLATSQPFPSYEPPWSTSMYEPSPPVNISSWNVPSWMPSIDYTPVVPPRQDYQFTPPPSHHTFEQLPTPPQQPRTPDPNLFILGSYGHVRKPDSQGLGVSNVSLPSSSSPSPYNHPRYPAVS